MDGFLSIVRMLELERITCELLIDGSFLTKEIEPGDIDFAVVVTPAFYENCTPQQRKLLDWIGDDKKIKTTYLCDCYLCINYVEGDPDWFEGINNRAWWLQFYAKSKVVQRDRGIVVVKIEPKGLTSK